jgi:hypothetical protein
MVKIFITIFLLLFSSVFIFRQADYETNFLQSYLQFEQAFQQLNGNYGTTFFPFLTMGYGGRERGLSGAFTSVADDITTIESNPAGTASLKDTELFFSHAKLMSDVNYNTMAYTIRFNDLGCGVGARVLYMPFTHFSELGDNLGSSVISYSVFTFNLSYNLLRSYDFFGLSVGTNVKLYVYGVPDVLAANQSKVNLVFDLGLLSRFDLFKFYNKVEKNFSIGIVVKNLGPFTDNEPPPTTASIGLSYKPIDQLLFSTDFNYLIDYTALTYLHWSVNTGIEWKFTKFSSFLAGATIKSSPSFSLGFMLDFEDFKITATYNPDFVDVAKFSISASLKLGDMGREKKRLQIKSLYSNALNLINQSNYKDAKDVLVEILKLDYAFTPAKKNLDFCNKQISSDKEINDLTSGTRLQ